MNNNMSFRLKGLNQQERMINDKKLTLKKAVQYSYQGAKIRKYTDTIDTEYPALINPNRLIDDYDEKLISIDFSYNIQVGDIIVWKKEDNDTNWIVYLQDLTELAYFKARARRCNYSIKRKNSQGIIEEWPVSVIGPNNSLINSINKSKFSLDIPNYTISIFAPKNEETVDYFKRYNKFYLQDQADNISPSCWRVESVDSFSLPGVLQIYAKEYYINDDKDIVYDSNGNVSHYEVDGNKNNNIVGDADIFIKPKTLYNFTQDKEGTYRVTDNTLPIKIIENGSSNNIQLMWDAMYSGEFELEFIDDQHNVIEQQKIIVKSLM